MSEHSPGPWTWDGPDANIHVVQADQPHMRVCFLTSDGPTRANARLIAAAPDMLAALTRYMETFDRCGGSEAVSLVDFANARADMRDAIAKATAVWTT